MPKLIYTVEQYYRFKSPLPLTDLFAEGGEWRATCPFCKHPGQKLYIEQTTGRFYCHIPDCEAHSGGNIIGYHALAKNITKEEARAELMYDVPSTTEEGTVTPRIDKNVWLAQHNTLLVNTAIVETVCRNWQVTQEAIEHFKLGWVHESGAITFPIFDRTGKCINIRYKKLHVPDDYEGAKIWNHSDSTKVKYGSRRLYPETLLDVEEELFYVGGEKDMISTWSAGIHNVITSTGGEGNWNSEWNFDIQNKRLHFILDNDEQGIYSAKKHYYEQVQHICTSDVVILPKMPDYESGKPRKDLTDFWLLGKKPNDLLKLIPDTDTRINSFNGGSPIAFRQPLPVLYKDEDRDYLEQAGDTTIVDEYINYARSYVNSPPSYHRLCCLWLISNLLGRKVTSQLGSTSIYPNLWCILVGPTTIVQKSTTTEFARDILREVDKEAIAMTSFTPEGAITTLMEREEHLTSAIYYDEIGQLFDQIKNRDYMSAMRDYLIKMYNNDVIDYRKANEQKRVENSYVTLLGSGVPTRLAELLSWRDIESGFLIRFLIALELNGESYQPRAYESEIQSAERRRLLRLLSNIRKKWSTPWRIPYENGVNETTGEPLPPYLDSMALSNHKRPYRFVMEHAVLERYNQFSEACAHSDEVSRYEHVAMAHARLPMLLQKIMMIYAASDPNVHKYWNYVFVDMKHLLLAIRDLDWYRRHMVDLILQVGSSEIEHFVVEVYSFLFKRKRATRTEIARKVNTDKRTLDNVIDTMMDRGLIQSRRISSTLYEYMPCLN